MSLEQRILQWLANGQTGLSSKAMAFCAAEIDGPIDHPYDPADFNRCLLLVCLIPEVRESFQSIAGLSPEWKSIIEHWDELEAMFIDEAGLNWEKANCAPKTYARMQELLQAAREALEKIGATEC